MPPLTAIERFFERLFERPSARLFRTRMQPVQLQRRIERAMEAERLAASDRTLVPNRFVVRLNPEDLEGFAGMPGEGGGDPIHTMVFQVPRPSIPAARLRVHDATGIRMVEIWTGLTVGRATDNDLVLRDERVSRHHARIGGRRGTLVFTDLGSTNGSEVNGTRVSEVVLGAGDRIRLGGCVLEVEVGEAAT